MPFLRAALSQVMGILIWNFPVTSPQGVRTRQSENLIFLVLRRTWFFFILHTKVEWQEIFPLLSSDEVVFHWRDCHFAPDLIFHMLLTFQNVTSQLVSINSKIGIDWRHHNEWPSERFVNISQETRPLSVRSWWSLCTARFSAGCVS